MLFTLHNLQFAHYMTSLWPCHGLCFFGLLISCFVVISSCVLSSLSASSSPVFPVACFPPVFLCCSPPHLSHISLVSCVSPLAPHPLVCLVCILGLCCCVTPSCFLPVTSAIVFPVFCSSWFSGLSLVFVLSWYFPLSSFSLPAFLLLGSWALVMNIKVAFCSFTCLPLNMSCI